MIKFIGFCSLTPVWNYQRSKQLPKSCFRMTRGKTPVAGTVRCCIQCKASDARGHTCRVTSANLGPLEGMTPPNGGSNARPSVSVKICSNVCLPVQ